MLLCNSQPSLYQRYFAENMESFNNEYDTLVGPMKTELFSRLFSYGDITNLVEVCLFFFTTINGGRNCCGGLLHGGGMQGSLALEQVPTFHTWCVATLLKLRMSTTARRTCSFSRAGWQA